MLLLLLLLLLPTELFSAKITSHWFMHLFPSWYSTRLKVKKYGEKKAAASIHVPTIKQRHTLRLMRGERSGTTTAAYRSTVIRIRLWIDTNEEISARKACILHQAWPRVPPISHEPTCKSVSRTGIRNIGRSRSDMAMFAINIFIGFLKVGVL